MAAGKEIRVKIKSVEGTKKITKAMEMVAASKMRRAQERMRHARPYADKVRDIAAHMAQANPEYIPRTDSGKLHGEQGANVERSAYGTQHAILGAELRQ